jgi:hypothetical protein
MLDTKPKALWEEIEAAERYRDSHLEGFDDQIAGYYGPHFKSGDDGQVYSPENHTFEYVSLTEPRCVSDNPRVMVRSRRGGPNQMVAESLKHALNRWARESDVAEEFGKSAVYALFRMGVGVVTQQPDPRYSDQDDPPYWPAYTTIDVRRYFQDPLAQCDEDVRYQGHKWVTDKDTLIERAETEGEEGGWDLEQIKELQEDIGVDDLGRPSDVDNLRRREVVIYEVWIPEDQDDDKKKEDGFHGRIHTLALANKAGLDEPTPKSIRKPRAYYGPRWGPYVLWGIHRVPGSAMPLSPLVAVEAQARDLNRHAIANSESAARYKRIILVDATDKTLPEKVAAGEHDFVFPVNGLAESAGRSAIGLEIGGITEQQLSYLGLARDRLDRNSGLHDAQRGVVTGRGTATEVNAASAASDIRMSHVQKRIRRSAERALRTVAWYLHEDDRVFFPLGPEAQEMLGIQGPMFFGGEMTPKVVMERFGVDAQMAEQVSAMFPPKQPFDDIEVEIELYSMERVSERDQQAKAQQMFELVTQVAPVIPMNPHVDWGSLFKVMANAFNQPELGDVVDMQVAFALGQAQMAAEQTDPNAQPRLNRDQTTGQGGGGQATRTPGRSDRPGVRLTGNMDAYARRNTTGDA